jgi:hypothetical protein
MQLGYAAVIINQSALSSGECAPKKLGPPLFQMEVIHHWPAGRLALSLSVVCPLFSMRLIMCSKAGFLSAFCFIDGVHVLCLALVLSFVRGTHLSFGKLNSKTHLWFQKIKHDFLSSAAYSNFQSVPLNIFQSELQNQ